MRCLFSWSLGSAGPRSNWTPMASAESLLALEVSDRDMARDAFRICITPRLQVITRVGYQWIRPRTPPPHTHTQSAHYDHWLHLRFESDMPRIIFKSILTTIKPEASNTWPFRRDMFKLSSALWEIKYGNRSMRFWILNATAVVFHRVGDSTSVDKRSAVPTVAYVDVPRHKLKRI